MGGREHSVDAEQLLAHSGWLRDLARRLVRDADVADDLVQETLIASVRSAPEARESVRPWLAKVMRNVLRMRARGEGRRAAREQVTTLLHDEVPTPAELVARAEVQRTLVDLVLRLEEPYRSTVLLHVCEGVPLAESARRQGLPASTVRWRLQTALAQLRTWLDAEPGGRKRWLVALAAGAKGVSVAQKSSKLAIAIVLLLIAGGIVWFVARGRGGSPEPGAGSRVASTTHGESGALGGTSEGVDGGSADAAAPPPWLLQVGIAPRRIAGRVVFQGAPVAGAAVELASLASEGGLVAAPRRVTNAAGEFDFGLRPAVEWSVRAASPHRTPVVVDVDLRDPTRKPAPDALVLELGTCDVALVGTVRDASGGPIEHARLARLPDRGAKIPGGATVETDAAGSYELCVAPA